MDEKKRLPELIDRYFLKGINLVKSMLGYAVIFLIIHFVNKAGLLDDYVEAQSNAFLFYLTVIMSYIIIREFHFKLEGLGFFLLSTTFLLESIDELIYFPDDGTFDRIEDFFDDYMVLLSIILMFIGFKIVLSHKESKIDSLKHKSLHDPLTGIYNRSALFQLYGESRINEALTFCYIDLDGFKAINDTRGHDTGDHVLRTFADTVSRSKRGNDEFFRIGGDEFILVLNTLDLKITESMIDRLNRLVKESLSEYAIDFSSGLVALTRPMQLKEVLKQADAAMYEKKKRKKGR